MIGISCKLGHCSRRRIRVAAGGHIGYGALGSSVVRAAPLNPHFYGPVPTQVAHLPVCKKTQKINSKLFFSFTLESFSRGNTRP